MHGGLKPISEMSANYSSQIHTYGVVLLLSFINHFMQPNPRQRDRLSSYMHPIALGVVLKAMFDRAE